MMWVGDVPLGERDAAGGTWVCGRASGGDVPRVEDGCNGGIVGQA